MAFSAFYGNPEWLFLSGMLLATALVKSGLMRRASTALTNLLPHAYWARLHEDRRYPMYLTTYAATILAPSVRSLMAMCSLLVCITPGSPGPVMVATRPLLRVQ